MGYLKLRSTVKTSLKQHLLIRGTILGALGAILILLTGAFMPIQTLTQWGLLIFFIGGGLVAWGLLPYRRLTQLEMKPHLIVLDEEQLVFFMKGDKKFAIPIPSIEKWDYYDQEYTYGIMVWLKNPLPQKIIVLDSRFDLSEFERKSKKTFGCDLFLPYFSRYSYEELAEHLYE